jgi:phosphoribosylformylglycinamidine synthase
MNGRLRACPGFGQIGFDSPDIEDVKTLNAAVEVTQTLIEKEPILSGHERSDGGLATTSLEMAFAGTCSST